MARLNHLIIVIPGLGGSVLRRDGGIVWDATLHGVLSRLARPGPLALDAPGEVVADGLAGPFGVNPFWAPFPGYGGLMAMLRSPFRPRPSIDRGVIGDPRRLADIAAFPYDFRQSVATTACLLGDDVSARQRARRQEGRPHRLIVVAHSLGGLVARHWLANSPEAAGSCDLLITLGTPHEGSPMALKALAGGVRAFGRAWSRASTVVAGWPSMYELLPRYRAVLDGRVGEGEAKAPHELPLPGLQRELANSSVTVHDAIDTGWAEGGPAARVPLVPFVGTGQRTLQGATWNGTELSFERGALSWQPEGAVGGDGTVPDRCAEPRQGDRTRTDAVSCRHGWLVEVGAIAARVERVSAGGPYLGDGDVVRRTHMLALDPDDVMLVAGDRLRAEVVLRGHDGAPVAVGRHPPTVRLRIAKDGTRWQDLRLEPAGTGAWSVASPPLEAGTYQIEASAPHWLGREQPPVHEVIAVVDEAGLAAAVASEADDQ